MSGREGLLSFIVWDYSPPIPHERQRKRFFSLFQLWTPEYGTVLARFRVGLPSLETAPSECKSCHAYSEDEPSRGEELVSAHRAQIKELNLEHDGMFEEEQEAD